MGMQHIQALDDPTAAGGLDVVVRLLSQKLHVRLRQCPGKAF